MQKATVNSIQISTPGEQVISAIQTGQNTRPPRDTRFDKIRLRHIGFAIIGLKILLVGYLFIYVFPKVDIGWDTFDSTFVWFVAAGFVAQMIDGTLG
ncbi:MAG: hypothetical protein MUE99_09485, partial [Chitinophagaceae bacterium]|nr:hypothetical protein [Chitinophagaceae bacterium]